ncbi:hypothetical protein T06_10429 [Trichinella sp. T6]|nr:hypothetical protein T06_10429 [Trichinella sp. T6]
MKGTARFDKDSALLTPLPICSREVMCLKERNGVTAYLWIESKNHVLMILLAAKTQFRKGLVVVDTPTCWCDSQMATLRSKSSSSTFLCNGHRYRHYDRLRTKQDSEGTESLREAVFGTKSRGISVSNQLQQQPRRFVQNYHDEVGQICIGSLFTWSP